VSERERHRYPALVQVADGGWPGADESLWDVDLALRPVSDSDGVSGTWGTCTIEQDFGPGVHAPGQPTTVGRERRDYDGKFIRILIYDPDGDVTPFVGSDLRYRPTWWGWIESRENVPDGRPSPNEGGRQVLRGLELAALLDRVFVDGGDVRPAAGGPSRPLYRCPAVNDPSLDLAGNVVLGMSNSTDPALGTHIFQPGGLPWSISNWLRYVLARFARPQVPGAAPYAGPAWSLGTDQQSLTNTRCPPHHPAGLSVAQVISDLAGGAFSAAWRVEIVSGEPVVRVLATSPEAQTVGGETTPAAQLSTSLDWRGDIWIRRPRIRPHPAKYDAVSVEGARPWVGMTTAYIPGDSTASTWLPQGWSGTSHVPEAEDDLTYRLYRINPAWNGQQYADPDSGLRHVLTLAGATAGARTWSATGNPPPELLEWTASLPPIGDPTDSPGAPKVFASSTADQVWEDLGMAVQVRGPDLILGSGIADAQRLRACIAAGRSIVITLGVREWAPLRAYAIAAESGWPQAGNPRVAQLSMPELEEWVVLPYTILSVEPAASTLITSGATLITVRNALETLRQSAARAAARLLQGGGSAQWTEIGRIASGWTSADLPPGLLVGSVASGWDTPLNAIIVERRRNYQGSEYGTTWVVERPPVSILGS
jgi:hypothetical protein